MSWCPPPSSPPVPAEAPRSRPPSGDDDHKKAEQSILDDAAKRLNVTPEALRGALGAAEDAQLDQQVKDGKLTQEQADAIKKRRADSGDGARGPGCRRPAGGPGFPAAAARSRRLRRLRGLALQARRRAARSTRAATALGLSRDDLARQLRAGQSIADVAKAQGKSLDDVKAAITDGGHQGARPAGHRQEAHEPTSATRSSPS